MKWLTLTLFLSLFISTEASAEDFYIVQKGDTLSEIAMKFMGNPVYHTKNGTLTKVINLNPSHQQNPDLIYPGQKIRISQLKAIAIKKTEKKTHSSVVENKKTEKEKRKPASVEAITPVSEFSFNTDKVWYFNVGAGLTSLNYTQSSANGSNVQEYSSIQVTAKLGASYRLTDHWDLSTNLYMNLAPLSNSRTDGVSARFFGANFRIGYRFIFDDPRWSLLLSTGVYYMTMFVTNNAFGFQNVAGPQLFPLLVFNQDSRNTYFTYLKYSPISTTGFSLFSFQSREIAGGFGWIFPVSNDHTLTLSLDISSLKVDLPVGNATNFSGTLGVGYGF